MASAKTPPRRPVPTVFQVLPPSENGEDDHAEPTDPARSHDSVADVRRLDSGPTADNETGDDGKTELDDEDAPHSPTSAVPQPSASGRAARADGFRRYAEAEERGVRLGIGAYRARGEASAQAGAPLVRPATGTGPAGAVKRVRMKSTNDRVALPDTTAAVARRGVSDWRAHGANEPK